MWWWQSHAPGGALIFAGSVPEEFGTCWARLSRTERRDVVAASAASEAPLTNVRRAIMFLPPLFGVNAPRQDLPKPYSVSGFCTRMRLRVASSGAHSVIKSNSSASSGLLLLGKPGCGQSLPHTRRSGAALTNACAILVASG